MRVKHWDYRELRERIADGDPLRRFTQFYRQPLPQHDAFHRVFTRLTPETLHAVNALVVQAAVARGLEAGTQLRVDTTVVETDIHYPTDATLLWDPVRVLTRLGGRVAALLPRGVQGCPNRRRAARRRQQAIQRMPATAPPSRQGGKYRELLGITTEVVAHARGARPQAARARGLAPLDAVAVAALCKEITHYCALGDRVIAQARRRVLEGEQVPTAEKRYAIFEPHPDLSKRGKVRTPVEFGPKVLLAESARGLITQYRVLAGNPADTDQVPPSLDGHRATFGRAPDLYSADRGFYSAANLQACEAAGVALACIPQRGGTKTPEREAQEKSPAFTRGQRFRAGIEGRIAVLFRGRGMKRVRAEGPERFEVLVGAAVLANNLLIIAKLLLAKPRRHRRVA